MKTIQYILFAISMIVGTITVNAQNTMLILAPQNDDVIYVEKNTTSIPLLLSISEEIDSTFCEISFNNNTIEKIWSEEDPYTLEIPVTTQQNIAIQITTYYQGKIQKTEKINISFKKMDTQFGFAND